VWPASASWKQSHQQKCQLDLSNYQTETVESTSGSANWSERALSVAIFSMVSHRGVIDGVSLADLLPSTNHWRSMHRSYALLSLRLSSLICLLFPFSFWTRQSNWTEIGAN